jgi:hypothetical protein
MTSAKLDQLRAAIRDVADFPKPGILFKDIHTGAEQSGTVEDSRSRPLSMPRGRLVFPR